MLYNEFLSNKTDLPKLKRFAYLGNTEEFEGKLKYLISIAEPEKWNQIDSFTQRKDSTIFYYIIHTFDRVFEQEKIFIDSAKEHAFFNTGLMTIQGNEIFGHFTKSIYYKGDVNDANYWYLKGFTQSNDRELITCCNCNPEIATYYLDFNELYFNPEFDIEINFDHIYDDNFNRLPVELQTLPSKDIARHVFNGFLDFTKKKIKRNNRIPVPQYYNSKIMFLIPVRVFGTKTVVIALEKINNKYVANTILTMGMAYNCARLLNKPESDWLLQEE